MLAIPSTPCEAAGEELDAGDHDPSGCAGDGRLKILGEASVPIEPSERAFDDPTSRLRFERPYALGPGNDLDGPLAQIGECVEQLLPAIDAVGEDMPQLGEHLPDPPQQWDGAVAVLHIGGLHEYRKQRALRVGHDVALAALHFLSNVKAAWTATFRGLHGLTVDDAGRRRGFASNRRAHPLDEDAIDPMPGPVIAPAIEIALHGRAGRKVLAQCSPRTARPKHVQNGIYHR